MESRERARLLREGNACEAQLATILREPGRGRSPTIVLGGFVPDAVDQVFLLRRLLLRSGDVYYIKYPRARFSLPLLCAQLDDLVDELSSQGCAPVLFGVSFGAGIALEWLRRGNRTARLGALVLVSPVACLADVIDPTSAKPATLLGRALLPYLEAEKPVTDASVEKSRLVFRRMFEAGAQNKTALRQLMSVQDIGRIRDSVTASIREITTLGSLERVRALTSMPPLTDGFSAQLAPLTEAPALVLFAEREEAVLDPHSPTRFALDRATRAYLPNGRVENVLARPGDAPVQHASLVFHVVDFLPHLETFYREVRQAGLAIAA